MPTLHNDQIHRPDISEHHRPKFPNITSQGDEETENSYIKFLEQVIMKVATYSQIPQL